MNMIESFSAFCQQCEVFRVKDILAKYSNNSNLHNIFTIQLQVCFSQSSTTTKKRKKENSIQQTFKPIWGKNEQCVLIDPTKKKSS